MGWGTHPAPQAALVTTNLTITWNLIKSYTSLCVPLENVNDAVRLHVIVWNIMPAYL